MELSVGPLRGKKSPACCLFMAEVDSMIGAGNGGRTRDPQLGKLMLYH